jgi:hypothetical protein
MEAAVGQCTAHFRNKCPPAATNIWTISSSQVDKVSSIFCNTKEEASLINITHQLPGGVLAILCAQSDDTCAEAVVVLNFAMQPV